MTSTVRIEDGKLYNEKGEVKEVLLKVGGFFTHPTLVLRCMLDVIAAHNPMLAQAVAAGLHGNLMAGEKGTRPVDDIAAALGVDADALIEACNNRVLEVGVHQAASEARN